MCVKLCLHHKYNEVLRSKQVHSLGLATVNRFCRQIYWNTRKTKAEQNAGIIGANSSKICLISYVK